MFGDHVAKKVIMGLARDEDVPLMKMESGNDRGGRGGNVGGKAGKEVGPLISHKAIV